MWKKLKRQGYDKDSFLTLTAKEKRYLLGKSILIISILNYFFYRSIWAFIPLSGVGFAYFRMEKKMLRQKKKEAAREQFKELLLLVSTGQKAGYSAENAFLSSYQDMKALFGEDSSVCHMICILKSGRENNVSFSGLWKQIGSQFEMREIIEFAQVYEISQKSSGNMAAVMEKTANIIVHQIETEKEIVLLLSARILEQKIMNVMPFLIMFYISITSPGYFDDLYHSPLGILIMSFCLFIYLAAYILSVRMVLIEI